MSTLFHFEMFKNVKNQIRNYRKFPYVRNGKNG